MDEVWCTGANWATKITTEADLDINGLKVPKGSYSIWTLPSDKQWMLIINKQTGQFHLDYDQSQDFARVKMNVKTLPSPVETLKIEVQSAAVGAPATRERCRCCGKTPTRGFPSRCCTKAPGAKLVLGVARSVGGLRHILRHHLLAINAQHAPGDG